MGFVFRSDKKSYLEDIIDPNIPGPGTYVIQNSHSVKHSQVPFFSSEVRSKPLKRESEIPGPGAYDVIPDLRKSNLSEDIFAPSPKPKNLETQKQSKDSRSPTQKSPGRDLRISDTPGPGAYNIDKPMGKRIKVFPRTDSLDKLKVIKYNSVPSIPSQVHNYGYVVNESQETMLVKNPLNDVYKDVGPGYYNIVPETDPSKAKGTSWHKSGTKRFSSAEKFNTPETVGPGSYDPKDEYVPSYKTYLSSGFASKSRRAFDVGINPKYRNESGGSSLYGSQKGTEASEGVVEYIEGATPGPGYYYNPSTTSSFKTNISPSKRQIINTDVERFKDNHMKDETLGPGYYDLTKEANPKQKVRGAPFTFTDARFEKMKVIKSPGPGAYDPKTTIEDSIEEKAKLGQVSFGTTEKRFKFLTQSEIIPGPGYYTKILEEGSGKPSVLRASASFAASGRKTLYDVKKDVPAPGTYDYNNFAISKAVIQEEDDENSEFKPIRSTLSQAPRFTELKKEEETKLTREARIDYLKKKTGLNLDSLFSDKNMKPKLSAAFAASERNDNIKSLGPGPGAYFNPDNNSWNKRTFNIVFSDF